VDGNAVADANPIRGGELGKLQDEISGEVFSRFCQTCFGC